MDNNTMHQMFSSDDDIVSMAPSRIIAIYIALLRFTGEIADTE